MKKAAKPFCCICGNNKDFIKGCVSYLTNAKPDMFSVLEKRLNGKSCSPAERVMRTVNMRVNGRLKEH